MTEEIPTWALREIEQRRQLKVAGIMVIVILPSVLMVILMQCSHQNHSSCNALCHPHDYQTVGLSECYCKPENEPSYQP